MGQFTVFVFLVGALVVALFGCYWLAERLGLDDEFGPIAGAIATFFGLIIGALIVVGAVALLWHWAGVLSSPGSP